MAVYADASSPAADRVNPIQPRRSRRTASASWRQKGVARQILDARGIPFTAVRYFNTFGPGSDLHAVCRRDHDLRDAAAARRGAGHLRRWRAAARFRPRRRHCGRNDGRAGPRAGNLQPRHRSRHIAERTGGHARAAHLARDDRGTCPRAAGRAAVLGRRHQRGPPRAGLRPVTYRFKQTSTASSATFALA